MKIIQNICLRTDTNIIDRRYLLSRSSPILSAYHIL